MAKLTTMTERISDLKEDEEIKDRAKDEWLTSSFTEDLASQCRTRREQMLHMLVKAAAVSSDPEVRGICGQLLGYDQQIRMLTKGSI
jgi:hypothetical protein